MITTHYWLSTLHKDDIVDDFASQEIGGLHVFIAMISSFASKMFRVFVKFCT